MHVKKNVTYAVEKEPIKSFTMRYVVFLTFKPGELQEIYNLFFFVVLSSNSCETDAGDERDIVKTVHKCLNRSVVQRTISKQEAMCELAKLPMVTCSETIETVSLSSAVK
jgi:hypothetical protein